MRSISKHTARYFFTICLFCFSQTLAIAQQGNEYIEMRGLSLQVEGLPTNQEQIIWERLPQLNGDQITIFEGEENVSAFNHHPTIIFYKDRFFAAWSNGAKDEDASGQRVMYTTSKDGFNWDKVSYMTDSITDRAHTPGGFWVRDGQLFALVSLRDSRGSSFNSDRNPLLSYRWNTEKAIFEYSGIIARNFFSVDGPRLVSGGQKWIMFGKPGFRSAHPEEPVRIATTITDSIDEWVFKPLPNKEVPHDAFWYTLPDGRLMTIEAKGDVPNRHLISMYSNDEGDSWSQPESSNFPDADSRLYGLRLSNGLYVILNNPNLLRYRIPLSIAISGDGENFNHFANIRIEQTNKEYSGHAKAPGYQYVRAFEHDNKLWVIYSVNKEDIEITAISLDEIERFYESVQKYHVGNPSVEIVVDNQGNGFETDSPWSVDTATGIFDGVEMGYYGNNYSYRNSTDEETEGWAKWSPEITKSGIYSIYMNWATVGFGSSSPMSDTAPIEIKHSEGIHRSTVDQSRYGGSWIYLGAFNMNAGDDEAYVKVYSTKNGRTVADAVKFIMTNHKK